MSRMSTGRPPVTGFLIVVLAASLFGMLGPLSRFAYDAGMEPLSFVAWRGAIGFLAAAGFIGWRVANGREPLTRFGRLGRGERVTLLVAALLGFALNLAMFVSFDLITIALAPASRIDRMVGTAARIRRSLVMSPAESSGTLKSTRISTRLPLRSDKSEIVLLAIGFN